MADPIIIAAGRRSPLRTLLSGTFRRLSCKQNFVRPSSQALDPVFACPCCARTLTVPASQAGKKGRCRRCYQPIRHADPARDLAAVDLSRELDPISRPEDYPLGGHRATPLDYIPRGAIAAMPLLTLAAIGIALISLLPKGDAMTGAIAAAYGPTPVELIASPAIEAEELVSTFLTAPDWTYRVGHVLGGLDVAMEVAALTEHLPEGGFQTTSRINPDGTSTVRVDFQDGTLTHFQVANIDGEDLIIWDANPHGLPTDLNSRMVGMPEMEPK